VKLPIFKSLVGYDPSWFRGDPDTSLQVVPTIDEAIASVNA
jgi:hypothetical protein